jgi:hypothetical protein
VVCSPGAFDATPAARSVAGSKTIGSGVSVIATTSAPSRVTLTFALSEICGLKNAWTRLKSERHGSVANSE